MNKNVVDKNHYSTQVLMVFCAYSVVPVTEEPKWNSAITIFTYRYIN